MYSKTKTFMNTRYTFLDLREFKIFNYSWIFQKLIHNLSVLYVKKEIVRKGKKQYLHPNCV